MPLTITVTRGFTMVAGVPMSLDDWNTAFLPTFTVTGAVGSSDIADGAVGASKLSPEFINGFATTTALALDDKFSIYDTSAGANAGITVANALKGVFGLAPVVTFFGDYAVDTVTSHDGTSAQRMTVAYFAESLLGQAPALAVADVADEVLVRDASAAVGSQAKRVALANVLPDVGTPGAKVRVTGLTLDAKGRVTSVTEAPAGTGVSGVFQAEGTLPTVDGYASGTTVTITPSFGGRPSSVELHLECTTIDADWQVGDIVHASRVVNQTNSHPSYMAVWTTADTLKVVRFAGGTGPYLYRKDGAGASSLTTASWKFRLTAVKYA